MKSTHLKWVTTGTDFSSISQKSGLCMDFQGPPHTSLVLYEAHRPHLWYTKWNGTSLRWPQSWHRTFCRQARMLLDIASCHA